MDKGFSKYSLRIMLNRKVQSGIRRDWKLYIESTLETSIPVDFKPAALQSLLGDAQISTKINLALLCELNKSVLTWSFKQICITLVIHFKKLLNSQTGNVDSISELWSFDKHPIILTSCLWVNCVA